MSPFQFEKNTKSSLLVKDEKIMREKTKLGRLLGFFPFNMDITRPESNLTVQEGNIFWNFP